MGFRPGQYRLMLAIYPLSRGVSLPIHPITVTCHVRTIQIYYQNVTVPRRTCNCQLSSLTGMGNIRLEGYSSGDSQRG